MEHLLLDAIQNFLCLPEHMEIDWLVCSNPYAEPKCLKGLHTQEFSITFIFDTFRLCVFLCMHFED